MPGGLIQIYRWFWSDDLRGGRGRGQTRGCVLGSNTRCRRLFRTDLECGIRSMIVADVLDGMKGTAVKSIESCRWATIQLKDRCIVER